MRTSRLPFSQPLRFWPCLVIAPLLLVVGCGGGGGGGAWGAAPNVQGVAAKGKIANGKVTAYALKSDGTKGDTLAFTQTDANGKYALYVPLLRAFLLEISSGTYVDEATGSTIDVAAEGTALTVAVDSQTQTAAVTANLTPLTTLVANRALRLIKAGVAVSQAIATSTQELAAFAGVQQDLLASTAPLDLTTDTATSLDTAAALGFFNAGLCTLAQQISQLSGQTVTALDLVAALLADLQDGSFDGRDNTPGGAGAVQIVSGVFLDADAATADLANAIASFAASARNQSGLTANDTDAIEDAIAKGGTVSTSGPRITGVSPLAGLASGGTTVTVTGTGFATGAAVYLGGATCTVPVATGTQITMVTPARPHGRATVAVVNPDGATAALANAFNSAATPTLTAISPIHGPTTGSATLTLTGQNFLPGMTVTVGGKTATAVSASYEYKSATVVTPGGTAGARDVVVSHLGGSATLASGYTYYDPPAVTQVAPTSGTNAGGTTLALTGTQFVTGLTTVTVGGNPATNVVLAGSTGITCKTPSHAPGAVDVVVTTPYGTATATGGFLYVGPPTAVSVTPAAGRVAGGQTVTITGTIFITGSTTVTIGGEDATDVNVTSTTVLTCVTPTRTAGAKDVVVTTPYGNATLSGGFTYHNLPTVTNVTPTDGKSAGGDSVTIGGTNFVTGATTVKIGGTPATSVNVTGTTGLTCVTPHGTAGARDVVVTTPGGDGTLSDGFTYHDPPTVSTVDPQTGATAGGTAVTITGQNFRIGSTTVTVDNKPTTGITVNSATELTCETPSGTTGPKDVVVTTNYGSGTLADGFTYLGPPTIDTVSPNAGPVVGTTSLTITGTIFIAGSTTVTIGGEPATGVNVTSTTVLTCVTPTRTAGAKDVVVGTPYGNATLNGGFTYHDLPTVASVSPSAGKSAGGDSVTLTGTKFVTGAATVKIGTATATNVLVTSATTLTCVTPAGSAAAARDVVVTTPGGSGTLASGFTYYDPPTVGTVNPQTGATAGGTTVTITGQNFRIGSTTVTVDNKLATSVTVNSATELTCETPSGTTGPK
ncbi:IPT/TIG domain-containing protein, partial [Planctomycetota bacterium]